MSVTDILVDFAIASFFIAVGQLLRAKVPLVQKFFIPPSMIAGFIALALGAQGLGILPFSENIGSYASVLIILIFAGVGINGFSFNKKDFKAEIDRIGSYFSYKVLAQAIQFSLAPLFSILVISKLFPNIIYGFGLLLAAGFSGGHGTAAVVGTAFERLGDLDAMDIAMTCATVGILSGIFGGLFFIKLGTKKGWTKYMKGFNQISDDLRCGLVPKNERKSMGEETISSNVLDPLAWHLAVMLIASGIGVGLRKGNYAAIGLDLPNYLMAFLTAIVMFLVFRKVGVGNYIDENVVGRISGTATDYLVFFGVASIVAGKLADEGRSSEAVSIMIAGMTVANLFGVPLGTSLSHILSWRVTFLLVACWGVRALYYIWRWVPAVEGLKDTGFKGQFRFLKTPAPWLILGATALGNGGVFCWYSYITPLLTNVSGFSAGSITALMMLAGFGMVVGNLVSGRLSDKYAPGRVGMVVQGRICIVLLLIFFLSPHPWCSAILMALCTAGLFAVSSPEQVLIIRVAPGGEMLGGACVQMAFNLGNAIGAYVGGLALGGGYRYPALAGVPFALTGFILFVIFYKKFQSRY